MLRGLCLMLLASACIAGGAHAQVAEPTYVLPPPPSPSAGSAHWELGGRYWWSEGKTRFDIDSSAHTPIFGDPTSTLTYDGMNGNAGEFFWSARNETKTFAKGIFGAGGLSGGSLDDQDFFAGQVKFSDTYSKIEGNYLLYGTIDVGQDFTLIDNGPRVVVSPFVGFNYWQEMAKSYGGRCNRDEVGGVFCGPPGSIEVPFTSKFIGNESHWASLRLGSELKVRLWDRLTLRGDAAVLPAAYLWNDDYHYLRSDLGPVPNVKSTGTGWGYQLEGEVRFDVSENWALGAGVRYWYAETDGDTQFGSTGVTSKLEDFTSERFGVFGNVSYHFASF